MKFSWKYFLVGFIPSSLLGLCLILANASCANNATQEAAEKDKIIITVANTTDQTIYGELSAGLLSKRIEIPAKESVAYWGWKSMVPDQVTFKITNKPAPERKK